MVDIQAVVIGNAGTVVVSLFFIRLWIKSVDRDIENLYEKLEDKVSNDISLERYGYLKKDIQGVGERIREVEKSAK